MLLGFISASLKWCIFGVKMTKKSFMMYNRRVAKYFCCKSDVFLMFSHFNPQEPRVAAGVASQNVPFWDATPILHRILYDGSVLCF